ncbi:MAG: alkene reductase [Acidiferrobacterales bacterium]
MQSTLTAKNLFAPVRLGPYELTNRIVMAPMTRNRAGAGNAPSALNAQYYAQRASAGLIVTEASQVSPQGVGYPGTPGIHTDRQVEGWRLVTDAVHEAGGRIFLQLWHVGRISHPSLQPNGVLPVAPSAIRPAGEAFTPQGLQAFVTPRALETNEIVGVAQQFAEGARRAREAGFDGVEIHAANGYLIDQFLRDGSNHRTDRYGGSVGNRVRFLLEVTEAVSVVWTTDRVGVRISPTNPFNDMSDSDPSATFTYAARRLNEDGLAYLHVVEPVSPSPSEEQRLTPSLRQAFQGPLIVNGGYDATTGQEAIARGQADLVSFGTLFLANPDLPRRLAIGAAFNEPHPSTFYGGDAHGYIDYPALDSATSTGHLQPAIAG